MPQRFRLYIPIILLLLVTSCSEKQDPALSTQVSKQWKYISITDKDGNELRPVGDEDLMVLDAPEKSGRFSYHLKKANIRSSGSWLIEDSTLVFTYDLKEDSAVVDSITFSITDAQPKLEYYSDDKLLGSTGRGGFRGNNIQRRFKIEKISYTELVISENGVYFNYVYDDGLPKGVFSFTAIWRGVLGLITLLFLCFLFSRNRKAISWRLVISGLALQFLFALGVLKVPAINKAFEFCGGIFVKILSFTEAGALFVFGDLVKDTTSLGFIFAFQILPTILFFSAITSILFYLGIIQKIVYGFAWIMRKTMKLSGAESLSAAANIFLGQTEAPLLIKPYLDNMTKSELLTLMAGGMATIAGGVMAAYIGFLGGGDPVRELFYAKHLLAASVMSAPAAVVAAKMLVPQTEKFNESMEITQERLGANLLEAISIGTTDGLKLAVNVAAMLLVFLALIAMLNYILQDMIGAWTGLNASIADVTNNRYSGLTLQFILGYVGAPLSWLMGVCKEDMVLVGQLLGEKTILNEFVAYVTLGDMKSNDLFHEEKSAIIATYILCGFANFASIGIQIGGIGAIAPKRRTALSELGIMALIGGTMASLFTAVIVGMLI